jgi:hypothetical protein
VIRLGDTPDFREFFHRDDFVVVALAAGFPHEGLFGEELGEILVRRDHERLEAGGFGAFDQGADDVVRLEAVELQDRDVEGAAQRLDVRDGGGQFLRHFIALGLVGGKFDVARVGAEVSKATPMWRRVFLFQNGQQRVDEPVQRGRVDPLGVADRGLDQREMGAINQAPCRRAGTFGLSFPISLARLQAASPPMPRAFGRCFSVSVFQ